MSEQYDSRLSSGRTLAGDITSSATSLSLNAVPTGLRAGTYRLRIEGEILTGDHNGSNVPIFTNLGRGLEGTDRVLHRAGVTVRHVITGGSLEELRRGATQAPLTARTHPELYVRPPALRVYIAANFN